MIRTAIALLGLAAILAYLGLRQWEVRARAADTQVGLNLRELLTRGLGENTHVALSGFDYCDRFAYAEKRVGSGWSAAFFPIVPAGERTAAALGQETARVGAANADEANRAGVALSGGQGRLHGKAALPGKIGVIIVSKRLHSDSDVAEFISRPSIQGLVVDPSESLNRYERGELQGRFPTLDLSKCVVIEEGRAPPGRWLVALLFGGSGAALAFAGGLCVAAWRKRAPLSPPARSQADSPSQVEDWMRAQGKRVLASYRTGRCPHGIGMVGGFR